MTTTITTATINTVM